MVNSTKTQKLSRTPGNQIPSDTTHVQRLERLASAEADIKEFGDLMREYESLQERVSQEHPKLDNGTSEVTANALVENPAWGVNTNPAQIKQTDLNESTPTGSPPICMEIALASKQSTEANQPIRTSQTTQILDVVQRIISNSHDKTPRTWNIRLTIEGQANLKLTIDYRGDDQWCIGLLPDNEEHNEGSMTSTQAEDEILSSLQSTFPTLEISGLGSTGRTV